MQGHLIALTDGTKLEVKVNFGTIYYLQKTRGITEFQKDSEKDKVDR